ncbi:MAG TPA: hypothetical protein EYG93_03905 [Sulfurospirillum arcachonense]|nr:hypothetical protein [Sulfurospirillum arcachonense]HIP44464.1 hypothetical protein [Sulfurospirillum arcachonense]
MTNKFALHVEVFQHWYDNFEAVCFDVEDEDIDETKALLQKLINAENIDQKEIELLYALSMDNATEQKSDFIKFQAKKIVNFLNSNILQNVIRE